MPTSDLETRLHFPDYDDTAIGDLASHYKVSRPVILLKLIDQRILKPADFKKKTKKWNEAHESKLEKAAASKKSGGGDYYNTRAVYLGYRFLELAFGKYHQGRCSIEELSEHLNVKVKNVPGLEDSLLRKAPANGVCIRHQQFWVLGNYYPDQFPTFWRQFNQAVINGKIISVREAQRELESQVHPPLSDWVKHQRHIFMEPRPFEIQFVSEIFSVPHFLNLVNKKNQLTGRPCADPFIIAQAKFIDGCVVTEEKLKRNAAKIPNVCERFKIDCTNLQGFMEREGWTF